MKMVDIGPICILIKHTKKTNVNQCSAFMIYHNQTLNANVFQTRAFEKQ